MVENMNKAQRLKDRDRIVDKHANALLTELDAAGFDPIGVTGGVVFHATPEQNGSPCDVVMDGVSTNGEAFSPDSFIADVADAMGRGVGEGLMARKQWH